MLGVPKEPATASPMDCKTDSLSENELEVQWVPRMESLWGALSGQL